MVVSFAKSFFFNQNILQMKKQILAAGLLIIVATASFAQNEKGSIVAGVNGNIMLDKNSSRTIGSIALNPWALYFVKDNLALGISVENSLLFSRNKDSNQNNVTSYKLLIAPELRKYFGEKKLKPFIGISTGLRYSFYKYGDESSKTTFSSPDFYLAPEAGLSWWLNDRVFLDVKLSYDLSEKISGSNWNTLNMNVGIGIKLGK